MLIQSPLLSSLRAAAVKMKMSVWRWRLVGIVLVVASAGAGAGTGFDCDTPEGLIEYCKKTKFGFECSVPEPELFSTEPSYDELLCAGNKYMAAAEPEAYCNDPDFFKLCDETEIGIECFIPEHTSYFDGNAYSVGPSRNELVCAAARHTEAGEYKASVKSLEAADARIIHEVPRFGLLSRLAWAYFKAGDLDKAADTLAKAELTLAILVGILKCVEDKDGFYLARTDIILWRLRREDDFDLDQARDDLAMTGEFIDEVKSRMCGAAYDYVYEHESLEYVLSDAKSVAEYFEVKRRIEEATGQRIEPILGFNK